MPIAIVPPQTRNRLARLADNPDANPTLIGQTPGENIGCAGVCTLFLDDNCAPPIATTHIATLLANGYITGAAANHHPAEQRQSMAAIGFPQLAFAVSHALLHAVKTLLPAPDHICIGGSPELERNTAWRQGWTYMPHRQADDFIGQLPAPSVKALEQIVLLPNGSNPPLNPTPDSGCEVAPSCLECPLPVCRHDDPQWRHKLRDREIAAAVREHKLTDQEAAIRFSVNRRTISRILRRSWEHSSTPAAASS